MLVSCVNLYLIATDWQNTFKEWFGEHAVQLAPEISGMSAWLDSLRDRAVQLRDRAFNLRDQFKDRWSWESRVDMILDLIGIKS